MKDKYAFAFGFLESAVHRALRELLDPNSTNAHAVAESYIILRNALRDLQFNHGIELHWPVKEIDHG